MMRRLLAGLASALLVVAASGLVDGSRAEEPEATGWWWVGYPTAAPIQPKPTPTPPAGGLYVARAGTSPDPKLIDPAATTTGVSAALFKVPEDAIDVTLVLDVKELVGDKLAVVACTASTAWTDNDGGPWDQRPGADCSRFVEGVHDAEKKEVEFALDELVPEGGGSIDLVFVPAEPAPQEPGFSATLTARSLDYDVETTDSDEGDEEAEDEEAPVSDEGGSFGDFEPFPAGEIALPDLDASMSPTTAPVAPAADHAAEDIAFEEVGSSSHGFSYTIVLLLPLLLLAAGMYFGRALTQPVLRDAGAEG